MKILDYWLGPWHHYQCPFGHRFKMRGHRLTNLQPCHLCSEDGIITEGREINKEFFHAPYLSARDRLHTPHRGRY